MKPKLRDYQIDCAQKGFEILKKLNIVYFTVQVRCGKTLMSLETCKLYGAKKVLFMTKKKALSSIQKDYETFEYNQHFELIVINDESVHTIEEKDFDIIVHDEHHRHAAFPKPGKGTKEFKARFSKKPMIFLSGTPHPESYSQIYHQFWVSDYTPFKEYTNFYKWHTGMGMVKVTFDRGYGEVGDYSNSEVSIYKYYATLLRKISKDYPEYESLKAENFKNREYAIKLMHKSVEKVLSIIDPYLVKYTQQEAGFTSEIKEHVLVCHMKPETYKLANRLRKDSVIRGKSEDILADTAVKLMSKLHQMHSGTIKFESGNSMIIDYSKALFIKDRFKSNKIAIFYKFKAEWDMLKEVYGDLLTEKLDEFNSTDKNIALQIVSGREGVSLAKADYLVYLNIDFSATSYWQSRDRLTTMDRPSNDIFWVFSDKGIDNDVYKTVKGKKSFTTSVFKKLKHNAGE